MWTVWLSSLPVIGQRKQEVRRLTHCGVGAAFAGDGGIVAVPGRVGDAARHRRGALVLVVEHGVVPGVVTRQGLYQIPLGRRLEVAPKSKIPGVDC